jgi:hypothetical protein
MITIATKAIRAATPNTTPTIRPVWFVSELSESAPAVEDQL